MKFSFLSKTPGEIQLLIAGRVAEIRRRRDLSQQTLSRKSGVSLESVQKFEQSGEISLLSLIKIAAALEIKECVCDMLFKYITTK